MCRCQCEGGRGNKEWSRVINLCDPRNLNCSARKTTIPQNETFSSWLMVWMGWLFFMGFVTVITKKFLGPVLYCGPKSANHRQTQSRGRSVCDISPEMELWNMSMLWHGAGIPFTPVPFTTAPWQLRERDWCTDHTPLCFKQPFKC